MIDISMMIRYDICDDRQPDMIYMIVAWLVLMFF